VDIVRTTWHWDRFTSELFDFPLRYPSTAAPYSLMYHLDGVDSFRMQFDRDHWSHPTTTAQLGYRIQYLRKLSNNKGFSDINVNGVEGEF
jgi:hypothetical protein